MRDREWLPEEPPFTWACLSLWFLQHLWASRMPFLSPASCPAESQPHALALPAGTGPSSLIHGEPGAALADAGLKVARLKRTSSHSSSVSTDGYI